MIPARGAVVDKPESLLPDRNRYPPGGTTKLPERGLWERVATLGVHPSVLLNRAAGGVDAAIRVDARRGEAAGAAA